MPHTTNEIAFSGIQPTELSQLNANDTTMPLAKGDLKAYNTVTNKLQYPLNTAHHLPLTTRSIQQISLGDFMSLLFEILKLFVNQREQTKLSRQEFCKFEIEEKLKECRVLKDEGNKQLLSAVVSCALGVAAGACPILGATAGGGWIQENFLGRLSSGMRDMDTGKLFKGLSQMLQSTSDGGKSMGQIMSTFQEVKRKKHEHLSSLNSTFGHDSRSADREKNDDFQGVFNMLMEQMRNYNETARMINTRS